MEILIKQKVKMVINFNVSSFLTFRVLLAWFMSLSNISGILRDAWFNLSVEIWIKSLSMHVMPANLCGVPPTLCLSSEQCVCTELVSYWRINPHSCVMECQEKPYGLFFTYEIWGICGVGFLSKHSSDVKF